MKTNPTIQQTNKLPWRSWVETLFYVFWSPGSTRGLLQQEKGLCWKERQHGCWMLLQSLRQPLTPSHQPSRAAGPDDGLVGLHVLVLWPAHNHHGLHVHPLQEGESEGESLDQVSALKHGAVHLHEERTVAGGEKWQVCGVDGFWSEVTSAVLHFYVSTVN